MSLFSLSALCSLNLCSILPEDECGLSLNKASVTPISLRMSGAATPNAQMQAVLDELAALGIRPIDSLSAKEAREQPTLADAVQVLRMKQGKQAEPVARVEDRMIAGAGGELPIRIYWPQGDGPLPVVVYYHGGGWVLADLDTYDASARALANAAGAIVISAHYRQAPEHKFPAAHDDAFTAYLWALANAEYLEGDPNRVAVAGESAGGNLAAAVALRARNERIPQPVHQLLVYPVTNCAFDTPSQQQNYDARPLSTPMLSWFYEKYLSTPTDGANPVFSILRTPDLTGLPPATIITADIDPLRSEGEAYAQRLQHAGVQVDCRNYEGVTHEFFGMGAVVDAAREAVAQAGTNLRRAFNYDAHSLH
jgi:acetyl esterase